MRLRDARATRTTMITITTVMTTVDATTAVHAASAAVHENSMRPRDARATGMMTTEGADPALPVLCGL